jgi:hypothetical protein
MLTFGSFGGVPALQAATRSERSESSPRGWHAVETASFRIFNYGTAPLTAEAAQECEALRVTLIKRWGGDLAGAGWSPKCQIVLHPSDAAYLREVGAAGRDTVASSLVERKQGRIVSRRIDIRANQPQWQTRALGHELSHVILADRFAGQPVPRWVDEGIALLADPAEKRAQHLVDLGNAVKIHSEYRVLELVTLANYPATQRWGTFYGQSMSLVQFLVDQGGTEQFLRFVELAMEQGYERGLQTVYRIGIADLERRWLASVAARPRDGKTIASVAAELPAVVAFSPSDSRAFSPAGH